MREVARYNPAEAALVTRSRRRKARPCPCKCGTLGFCAEHRERLAAIRGEMFDGKGRYGQRADQRGYRPPKCNNPVCENGRRRGERYCAECVDAGWEEPE